MQNFNLADLDLQNAGSWPDAVKYICLALVFSLLVGLGYYFFVIDKNHVLAQTEKQSKQLENNLTEKVLQAANLPAYQQQLATIETNFAKLLRQLPKDTEIPGLLDDISFAGTGNGLNFKSITLKPEQQADFYYEIPIELIVEGHYHELGSFVSAIASLPRIVTLHDFNITHVKDSNLLTLTVLAKTYRYNEGEQHDQEKSIKQ